MQKQNFIRKTLASCLLVAVVSVSSMVTLAADGVQGGPASITVSGKVTVNGSAAASNGTIASGSTIMTGESGDSVATIDLGKLGRVQLLSQSNMILKFDDTGIYATLLVGKMRVMNMSGVTTTVTTKEGMAIGNNSQANTYVVETECGKTAVKTEIGQAVLRAEGVGGADQQVAAGTEAVAGSLSQTGCQPCFRPDPNSSSVPTAKAFLPLPVLLPLIIGAGIGTVIIANTSGGGNVDIGPGGIIVSSNAR